MKNIMALGAENKTSFAVMSDEGLRTGETVNDLGHLESFRAFETSVRGEIGAGNFPVEVFACDMHPDYMSARFAEKLHGENKGTELVKVQHHFAHIASCMLDNDINEKVIGVSFDGAGYGTDGYAWGGEFLTCTREDFERPYHLKYVAQPGGNAAAKEAWRMALSYLYEAYGAGMKDTGLPLFERIGTEKTDVVAKMIEREVNSPKTSSAGRLFDAVSSLIGVCDSSRYEAEAAILLEKAASENIKSFYGYEINGDEIIFSGVIRAIAEDLKKGVSAGVISAKFHNTIGEMIFNVSRRISGDTGIKKALISGGCFQNKYLVGYLEKRFDASGLELFKHRDFSTTDLGISVGQAVVASSRRPHVPSLNEA